MFNKLAELIVRRRLWVALGVALLTAFFALQIKHLKIVIDPNTMLPKDHPNVVGTNTAESLFGSKHVVVLGVSARDGGDVFRPEVLGVVEALTRAVSDVPGVKRHTVMSVSAERARSIDGKGDEMQVEPMLPVPVTEASVQALQRHLERNPVYQNILVSADGRVAAVSFAIQAGQGGFRAIMDKVQAVADAQATAQVQITSSGSPVFFANVERFAQRMAILFPIALVLIGLIHFEAFRTLQGLVLPLVTALLAVVWSLGIMGLSKVPMDAFNATTPILILAVAAGHAVQILKRYYEEYDRISAEFPGLAAAQRNDRAIVASLSRVAPVMITAGFVATLGFFSLLFFDVATIRTFGLFTGLGIVSALVIELSFIPALRSFLKPPVPKAAQGAQARRSLWDRLSEALANLVIARRGRILLAYLLLAAVSSLGLLFINQENSTKSYFGEGLEVRQQDRFLNEKLAGTNTLYVVFQGADADRMKDPALLALIEQTQRFIETLPDVGKTMSIVDLLKQMHRSMNGGQAGFDAIPPTAELISQYLLLYSMSGQPTDFDAYIDYEYRNANLTVWMKNDSSKYAQAVVKRIREQVEPKLPAGVSILIGGSVPQASALSETLVRGKVLNIAQMIGVVFLAGMVVFRSALAGLYLVVPLMVTVLVNFGVMGLTGIPLNTPNSVSSAMAIGLGADYAIYLLYRMREELRRLGDFDAALRETMRTAGKAVVYVASAIAGGYSVLMLSFNFYVHIWFGVLIVLSMIVSAATALVLVPALMKAFPPAFLTARSAPSLRTGAGSVAAGLLLATGLGLAPKSSRADELKAEEIMERSYQSTRLSSSVSEATFTLVAASGQERVRKTYGATKQQADGSTYRRVIRFLSPSDVRNTTTLIVENTAKEDDIWVYLPALKKARRLASNNKKSSFVGTDLSYGDLIGHKPADWSHRLLRQQNLNGVATYVVESLPRTAEVAADSGYSKRVSWVAADSFVPVKTEVHDPAGALLKTVDNGDIKLVDAKARKWQAMSVRVANHQTGHTTLIKVDRLEANTPVSDDLFTNRSLEKEDW
ncbi:outer membrane lipoprotein-sorting protein [Azohydromonas australica]|uniref:outer membrane lipoprotein-sorting protein n=1 Tax=Azohydromonas australica TaxID=364039 RepID=UPI0004246C31|nr:outer membrane lipoprotein-sorting protein [Azohydromonas australica]